MAYEQKEGGMNIFKNNYKEKSNQPDYTGKAMVDGKMKDVSCWLKEDRNGNKFFSCQIKDEWVNPNSAPPAPPAVNNDFDDDIPF